ncbi:MULTISPECIES: lycopene cyclase domain-containing protein [Microbacterium]|uniref:lycopene cyclase domain-containing protein n=1 Tax=Microbacterium TaxID=33882 RepID=UPI00277D4650|nr:MULTISPECIES: lycopene cyclase domain-containing protein [Microbacterium]MDQ1083843.1 lycopene cyclase domain-containing protein [Microbacterium sp. SORGH_AS_0344]MDQ1170878.1 lycopene cyclase domain-containing protein [Microbacterium proteolyticum]
MPGIYLGAILFSLVGMMLIDGKYSLVLWVAPVRAAATVLVGTAFFLAWDLVGIVTGVFVKGESPLFVGVELAPHLPLEEVFFLLFLSYLSLVMFAVFERWTRARTAGAGTGDRDRADARSRTHERARAGDHGRAHERARAGHHGRVGDRGRAGGDGRHA